MSGSEGERGKHPYLVRVRDSELFAKAGLLGRWESSETGEVIESCAILTTRPNFVVGELHDRMPVIIPPEAYAFWLDPGVKSQDELAALMVA